MIGNRDLRLEEYKLLKTMNPDLASVLKKGKGDGSIFNKKFGPDFPGETFRVFKEKEEKQYGEYRTRRLVLEGWDKLEAK
jgi:hypothetical protein